MGKPKRERSLPENEAMAVARNLRVSPRKLNLVAGLIRGKKVDHALADLEFSRKRIAQDVRKCVMSAVANAENNHNLDVNDLIVSEAWVGKNLVMKRFQARRPRPRQLDHQALLADHDHRAPEGRGSFRKEAPGKDQGREGRSKSRGENRGEVGQTRQASEG